MNIKRTLATTTTASLLFATNSQAFEVIKREDINPTQYTFFTYAQTNNTKSAEKEFLDRLKGVKTETFETFDVNLNTNNPTSNMTLTFPGSQDNNSNNSIVATLGGDGSILTVENTNPWTLSQINYYQQNNNYLSLPSNQATDFYINYALKEGLYSVSGKKYWYTKATANQTTTFNINFNQEIAAFGFYAYDLGDYGATLAIKLYANGQLVDTISNVHSTSLDGKYSGSVIYVGILGEKNSNGTYQTFDHIEFVAVNSNTNTAASIIDGFAFENMTVGTVEQLATAIIAD